MRRDEAIATLEKLKTVCITLAWKDENKNAIDMALRALRTQPTRIDIEWWGRRCEACSRLEIWNNGEGRDAEVLYCPECGKPLTKYAFDLLVKRIRGEL